MQLPYSYVANIKSANVAYNIVLPNIITVNISGYTVCNLSIKKLTKLHHTEIPSALLENAYAI